MKKSLVALAALAAVGAASAQSSVTLYGLVDIGYGNQTTTTRDGSGQIRTRGVMDGVNAGNRIGFRGTEDLGGGLKANFVVEQGISPTNNQVFGVRAATAGHQIDGFSAAGNATALSGVAGAYSTGTNRQSYVGLASSTVGTFNIGRQYTALYELGTLSGYAVGSEGMPGADKAHLHGQAGVGGTRANMIQYISPNFGGGFVARVQYGSGDGRESVESSATGTNGLTTDKARRFALMLQYANGPVSVAAAYTNMRFKQANNPVGNNGAPIAAGATTTVYGVPSNLVTFNPVTGVANAIAAGAILTGQDRTANLFQLGGSYDFGVAKLAGTYNRGKNGGAATLGAGQIVGAAGFNSTYRAYQLGVSVPFGAIVPFIAYGRATTDSDNVNGVGATPAAAATSRTEDYRQYQVGVRYSLSKRTTAYAMYGQTRNDAAALAGATSYYLDKKTIIGVAHSF
jgi:predicted porin